MPARQKSKKHGADAVRARDDELREARRYLCSYLNFYAVCGQPKCLRERTCVGDAMACFDRIWPVVPQDVKIFVRTLFKGKVDGLSVVEIGAEIDRQLALWRALVTPQAEAQPASHAPPQVAANEPGNSGPRLRVL